MSETANPSQAPAEVPSRQRQPRSIQERANQRLLEEAKDLHGQAREDARSYAEGGCFYASSTPIANAIGAELGVVTRDAASGAVQRTGIGFYIRSDHLCNHTYDGNVPVA